MNFIKENKSVICVLLIAILLFSFSTVVTSMTDADIKELGDDKKNTSQTNEFENISEKENTNTSKENTSTINDIVNTTGNKSNINTAGNTSTIVGPNKDMKSTSNNTLAKAGIEDYPSVILITFLVSASIYGYVKIKKYNSL